MVSCTRCGRALTYPRSIKRRMGRWCWDHQEKELAQAFSEEHRMIARSEQSNPEAETALYKALHDFKVDLVGTTQWAFEKTSDRYQKRGWIWIKDYSVHAPDRLKNVLEKKEFKEYLAILYDVMVDRNSEKPTSRMVVSLYRKGYTQMKLTARLPTQVGAELFADSES